MVPAFRLNRGRQTSSASTGNSGKERCIMRSDLVFGALSHVSNRYRLCQLASKATRKLHKPNTRLQDTTNEVLDRFKDTVPMDVQAENELALVAAQGRAA